MTEPAKPQLKEKEKIFFPDLDGLRFFSFLAVFFSHIFATEYDGIKNQPWHQFFKGRLFADGDLGVGFFFVLSGFLITYLLLKEKEYTGRIHVLSFYIRRALRIWPLYYFCVFFGFVIFPVLKSSFGQVPNETANPVLCSLFLNNFDRIRNGMPDSSVLSVLWSVAIEEQFYFIWPLLFFIIPVKHYHYIFILVITISFFYRATHLGPQMERHTLSVISDMAIGGLGAYFSIKNIFFLKHMSNSHPLLNLVPYVAVVVLLLFRRELFSEPAMFAIKRLVIAFFFIWIILEQNFCKRSYFKISRFRLITKLGKYTYGLYCLHTIVILFVWVVLTRLGLNTNSWQLWLIEMPLTLGLSILISYLSYMYFESQFLKLKDRFAYIVKS